MTSAPCLCATLGDLLRVRLAAGRGLGVHEGDDLGVLVLLQRILDLVRIDRFAPPVLDHHRNAAAADDVLEHAAAEHAVDAHDHLVSRRDQVDEAVLHPDRARARDREGKRVLGLVDVAQQRLQLLHHLDEDRVEVADRRLAHGGEHARVNLGRPRAHQRALRRMERMDALGRCVGIHGLSLRQDAERCVVGARFHAHRLLGARLGKDFDRGDAALGHAFDLCRPARRDVARLDPVVDHRAIELECARDVGLATE